MRWLKGRRSGARPGLPRTANQDDLVHLTGFARTRVGVEAFIEPRTTVTETTVVLVAASGEWTRRRVPSPAAARDFGKKAGIPVYDIAATGYPKRMREWTARRKAEGQTGVPRTDP